MFLQLCPSIVSLPIGERVYIITIETKTVNQAFLLPLESFHTWLKYGIFEFWITIQIWIFLLLSALYRGRDVWPGAIKSLSEVHTWFSLIIFVFSGCQVPCTNPWLLLTTDWWVLRQVSYDRCAADLKPQGSSKLCISWCWQCSLELSSMIQTAFVWTTFLFCEGLG